MWSPLFNFVYSCRILLFEFLVDVVGRSGGKDSHLNTYLFFNLGDPGPQSLYGQIITLIYTFSSTSVTQVTHQLPTMLRDPFVPIQFHMITPFYPSIFYDHPFLRMFPRRTWIKLRNLKNLVTQHCIISMHDSTLYNLYVWLAFMGFICRRLLW